MPECKAMIIAILRIRLMVALVLCLMSWTQIAKSCPQTSAREGLIAGTVRYEDGRSVEGATVYASPYGRAIGAVIPHADTDKNGHFAIRIPYSWFGKFIVAAKKEDENYPDMSEMFYNGGKFKTVSLTTRHNVARIDLQLGPKAGVLLGKVTDSATGASLWPCVEFRRKLNPENFLSGSGLVKSTYRLLIPSDAAILMKIWLDGYKPWYYPGTLDSSAQKAVRLRPGEEKHMDISLEAEAKLNQSGCPKPLYVGE